MITLDALKDSLIKNELKYNSCTSQQDKQFYYNKGYIFVHHFIKNYDVAANNEFIDFLLSSTLYGKMFSLINTKAQNVASSESKEDAISLRLAKIDNLLLEIKGILKIK